MNQPQAVRPGAAKRGPQRQQIRQETTAAGVASREVSLTRRVKVYKRKPSFIPVVWRPVWWFRAQECFGGGLVAETVFFLTFFYFFFKKSCFLDNFAIQLYIAIFNKKTSRPSGQLLYRVSSKEGPWKQL
jgi:hypothetical protein